MRSRLAVLLVALASCNGPAPTPSAASQPLQADGDVVPGELLVKFTRHARPADVASLYRAHGLHEMQNLAGVRRGSFDKRRAVKEVAGRLEHDPHVVYAEPNAILRVSDAFPDDPSFASLWGLHNVGQSSGTPDADIDAPEAWSVSTGDPS